MKLTKELEKDYYRSFGTYEYKYNNFRKNIGFRYIYYWRKLKSASSLITKIYYKYKLHNIRKRTNIEIPLSVNIEAGIVMIHPYSITINSKATIGKNFTILKGATIGNTKGKKTGTPIIGNNVYIGLNAVVVGNIKVGNNVLIAGNSFVNFDVPDNSIVIGNPGVVHRKSDATNEYITNKID